MAAVAGVQKQKEKIFDIPRKQLGTTRHLLDSDLSGSVVPTSSRHVITHGLTKGNSIGVENRTV